jgi:ATP adenylyltransferase
MNMDDKRIWAPWRIGYVSGEEDSKETGLGQTDIGQMGPPLPSGLAHATILEPSQWQPGADHACFLCRGAASYANDQAARQQNLVTWRGKHVYSILNRYPYTNGHLLVAPLRHVAGLHELTDQQHLEAMHTLGRHTQMLRQLLHADGFNIGLNLGPTAGAGVPGHLHWHLVPRWQGDHNFMPTLAGVRVIPQSLAAVWEAISEAS